MNDKDYWVSKRPDGLWQHKREGAERAAGLHKHQEDAWDAGKEAARKAHGEAFLKNRDGQIRERNTYGHDPRSTKG